MALHVIEIELEFSADSLACNGWNRTWKGDPKSDFLVILKRINLFFIKKDSTGVFVGNVIHLGALLVNEVKWVTVKTFESYD